MPTDSESSDTLGLNALCDSSSAMPPESSEQFIEVGESLKAKQLEWSELLDCDELKVYDIPENSIRNVPLRCKLAAFYYMDAVKGRRIDYPQSPLEVFCYRISRGKRFLNLFSLVTVADMVLPFFTQPYCAWTSDRQNEGRVDEYGSSDPDNYIDRHTVWCINVTALCIYYFDISTRFYTGYSVRTFEEYFQDRWLVIRVIACVALTVDYWGSHGEGGVYTVSTACIPLVYISRRHSLRQIVEGVIFAARKCVDVFLLLLFLILLWSFVGYLIFHNIEVDEDSYSKFDNLTESFYMCIQTFSTRGFLPFVLQPYYMANPASTLFFVSLTIITDLLCTALIIATGNRQYRVHANNVFKKLLRCRKQAVIGAYQLLCHVPGDDCQVDSDRTEKRDKSDCSSSDVSSTTTTVTLGHLRSCYLSRSVWLQFCAHIPTTRVTLTEEKMHMLFNLESHRRDDDTIGLESFFKLCATLDAGFYIGVKDGCGVRDGEGKGAQWWKNSGILTQDEVEIRDDSLFGSSDSISDHISDRISTLRPDVGTNSSRSSTSDNQSPKASPVMKKRKSNRRSSIIQTQNKKEELMRHQVKLGSPKNDQTDTAASEALGGWMLARSVKGSARRKIKIAQIFLRPFLEYTVGIPTFCYGNVSVNIFDGVVVVMRLLLVMTQLEISLQHVDVGWIYFWWFLEFYFWGEMVFLLLACGWKKYLKDRGLGIPIVVNIMSLVLMCLSSKSENRTGTVYILTVLTQSVRLPSLVMQYKAASVFNSIIPLVFRVMFIMFAVIYFFSALTFNRFCGVLNADLVNADIADGVDDFISPWVTYSNELNFRTFAGTLFTMFEISILGNWSSIMNSARKEDTYPPLFFFFTFRLIMMLCIYPILNSFIIATYIARKDLQETQGDKALVSGGDGGGDVDGLKVSEDSGGVEMTDLSGSGSDGFMADHNRLEINIKDINTDSMISFWSPVGSERFTPTSSTKHIVTSTASPSAIDCDNTTNNKEANAAVKERSDRASDRTSDPVEEVSRLRQEIEAMKKLLKRHSHTETGVEEVATS